MDADNSNGDATECHHSGLVSEIPAVNVTKFEDKLICGKRGGNNFLHSTRPDYTTGKCPGVLVPCSEHTSIENTICTHPDSKDSCPITDIEFLNKTLMPSTDEFKYETEFWNVDKTFVYSRDTNSLPITSTHIDVDVPCINSNKNRR